MISCDSDCSRSAESAKGRLTSQSYACNCELNARWESAYVFLIQNVVCVMSDERVHSWICVGQSSFPWIFNLSTYVASFYQDKHIFLIGGLIPL